MGKYSHASSRLPWPQYTFDYQWGEHIIESVWKDFAGADPGIIMTIWDIPRLAWFGKPRMGGSLEAFLTSKRLRKWAYIPIDSYGVGLRLTGYSIDALNGFDRILAYTMFGKQVLEASLAREVDWIPHGYQHEIFQPRNRQAGRLALGVAEDDVVVGCVMSNQPRKDWGTAFCAIAALKNEFPTLKFWAHVDDLDRHWNIRALIEDFGLQNTVVLRATGDYTSEQLSYFYSACDLTFLPSLGEGFGFPIVESLACGVPVIHGKYGGGAELIPDGNWLIEPVSERMDDGGNCLRPVWNPLDWAARMDAVLRETKGGFWADTCTKAVEHLRWSNLWPSSWKKWMLQQ